MQLVWGTQGAIYHDINLTLSHLQHICSSPLTSKTPRKNMENIVWLQCFQKSSAANKLWMSEGKV